MSVNAQRDRHRSVTEPTADCHQVHAFRDQLGGVKMPEGVQPDVRQGQAWVNPSRETGWPDGSLAKAAWNRTWRNYAAGDRPEQGQVGLQGGSYYPEQGQPCA